MEAHKHHVPSLGWWVLHTSSAQQGAQRWYPAPAHSLGTENTTFHSHTDRLLCGMRAAGAGSHRLLNFSPWQTRIKHAQCTCHHRHHLWGHVEVFLMLFYSWGFYTNLSGFTKQAWVSVYANPHIPETAQEKAWSPERTWFRALPSDTDSCGATHACLPC